METKTKQYPNSAFTILRYIGYSLLIFTSIDLIVILYPPDFTNPNWEFQMMGQIVERVPVPLIGFGLAFLGDASNWKFPERILLKFLSFLSLLVAALFLFLVPLGIVNTIRINNQNIEQITTQSQQRVEQLEQLKGVVGEDNPRLLLQIAQQLNNAGEEIEATNPEELTAEVQSRIEEQQTQIQQQAAATKSNSFRNLLENAIKWISGAFLSCILFAMIFVQTAWVRKLRLKQKKNTTSND